METVEPAAARRVSLMRFHTIRSCRCILPFHVLLPPLPHSVAKCRPGDKCIETTAEEEYQAGELRENLLKGLNDGDCHCLHRSGCYASGDSTAVLSEDGDDDDDGANGARQ